MDLLANKTDVSKLGVAVLLKCFAAVKTVFLCHYVPSEALRQEIHAGLNVVENWNSANGFIFYGKGGAIATNRRNDQELAILALHLLQICMVYVNTLMIQHSDIGGELPLLGAGYRTVHQDKR